MFQEGIIIGVDGNIGSGKSKFCGMAKEYLQSFGEKVIILDDCADIRPISPILKEFYSNVERDAYLIQVAFSVHICQQYWTALRFKELGYIVFLVSPVGKQVFTEIHHRNENISDYQYKTLNDIMDINMVLDYIIHINTSPKTCYLRNKLRNRDGELVDIQYLVELGQEYKSQLSKCDNVIKVAWNEIILDDDYSLIEDTFSKISTRNLIYYTDESSSSDSLIETYFGKKIHKRLNEIIVVQDRHDMYIRGLQERVKKMNNGDLFKEIATHLLIIFTTITIIVLVLIVFNLIGYE